MMFEFNICKICNTYYTNIRKLAWWDVLNTQSRGIKAFVCHPCGNGDTKRLSATVSTSTDRNSIPISIEGRPTLAFSFDDEEFTDGFHDFKIVLRDFTVNLGEGTDTRTFEYHKTFVAYILEFNFNGDQFVAFGEDNKTVSVFKNDSTLKRSP